MMKKGLCGIDLRHQVIVIGIVYAALSLFGIVMGFVLLENPDMFTDRSLARGQELDLKEQEQVIMEENRSAELSADFENYNATSEEDIKASEETADNPLQETEDEIDEVEPAVEHDDLNYSDVSADGVEEVDYDQHLLEHDDFGVESGDNFTNETVENYDFPGENDTKTEVSNGTDQVVIISAVSREYFQLIKYIQYEGLEAIIASMVKFICSVLLIMGARTGQPWYLVPWLVEEVIEMAGSFLQMLAQYSWGRKWNLGGTLIILSMYVLGTYFVYSVMSCHQMLRRMRKQSQEVISSVAQGGFQEGMNYQRLEEDAWSVDPQIINEFRDSYANNAQSTSGSGFTRERRNETEETDDHILYLK